MSKLKTYVLMVSERFPSYHPRKGEPTGFPLAIKHYDKIHTIRGNYELWKKRIDKVNAGRAVLELRIWIGKPYQKGSTQGCIFRYDKSNGIGIEKLTFKEKIMTSYTDIRKKSGRIFTGDIAGVDQLAKNDGLSIEDFQDWFASYDLTIPMAIIHFTDFRYNKK